jgi:hypothetical protein
LVDGEKWHFEVPISPSRPFGWKKAGRLDSSGGSVGRQKDHEGGGMCNRMTETDASLTDEQEAITMTFDEVVNRFCLRQAEFRARLARVGTDRTEPMGFTGGHGNGQT